MLKMLEQIIKYGGSSKLKKIQSDKNLLLWINQNCNKTLNSTECPKEQLLQRKIYSILHPNQPVQCFSGTWLKFISFTLPLRCRANCKCILLDVVKKRQDTCLKVYGVKNPQQNKNIRDKTAITCLKKYGFKTPFHSPKIQEQIKEKITELYGVKNISDCPKIKEKKRLASQLRYGTDYILQAPEIRQKISETNLSIYKASTYSGGQIRSESVKILEDPELLKQIIIAEGFKGAAEKLGVAYSTVYNYHRKFDLKLLNPFSSLAEIEICKWLNEQRIEFQTHNRSICKPQELDIYLPDYKLAIEFNGLYWHSEAKGKNKYYHQIKTQKCAEQGIQLIHIFEDEWLKSKNICKSIILGYLNQVLDKIAARKCRVEEVTNSVAKKFLLENHLQGNANATINIALKFNGELVELMTFRKPRYNKNIQWELIRLVSKLNLQVIGGTQKLWSYFQKKYAPNTIVSYCDRRWFSGKIYERLGFIKRKEAIPTYWYTDYCSRFHRSSFTKKLAIKTALKINPNEKLENLTENQITRDILGLSKIWDCGQDSWFWQKLDI